MKVFQQYLCELCSNAIARQRGSDEIEFVVCASGANGFPIDRRCPIMRVCLYKKGMVKYRNTLRRFGLGMV
jgi:hypothetical protein